MVKEKAIELNTILVYLPPYSPDLNPIEFGWKDLKKGAFLEFEKMIERSKEKALKVFGERKQTYSRYWREMFIEVKS